MPGAVRPVLLLMLGLWSLGRGDTGDLVAEVPQALVVAYRAVLRPPVPAPPFGLGLLL